MIEAFAIGTKFEQRCRALRRRIGFRCQGEFVVPSLVCEGAMPNARGQAPQTAEVPFMQGRALFGIGTTIVVRGRYVGGRVDDDGFIGRNGNGRLCPPDFVVLACTRAAAREPNRKPKPTTHVLTLAISWQPFNGRTVVRSCYSCVRMRQPSPNLVLASTSKTRAMLLTRVGIAFETVAPDFDESAHVEQFTSQSDAAYAGALALGKAECAAQMCPSQWVLAADQIAVLPSPRTLLQKPGTPTRAVQQLMQLSGRDHRLVTGVVLRSPTGVCTQAVDEHVLTMRAFSRAEAEAYVALAHPVDSVGSYHIEDRGITLFERLRGEDFTGIMGLPLLAVCRLLRAAGLLHTYEAVAR